MKSKNLVLVIVFSALSVISARAEPFGTKCTDIPACAKYVGELLGQKYIFSTETHGRMDATANLEINKDNAELLFTTMLNENGFTRVPLNEPNTFQIMRQRDARDSAIPLLKADKSHEPKLPNNWDMMTLEYKATNNDVVEHIARSSRAFMPANSRIIPDEVGGNVIITDSAANLKKIYELIKGMDMKPTVELKKQWEERRREWSKNQEPPRSRPHLKKAENSPPPKKE